MFINIKNKVSILPFVIETSGVELIENWECSNLHIMKANFYLLELTDNSKIWIEESFTIPMFIDGKYCEKSLKEISELKSFEEVKVLKYHTNIGMPFDSKNKFIKELFKDFSFKFVGVKKIRNLENENCIKVDDLIKKFILIDQVLVLTPNNNSISNLREKSIVSLLEISENIKDVDIKNNLKIEINSLKELIKIKEEKNFKEKKNKKENESD